MPASYGDICTHDEESTDHQQEMLVARSTTTAPRLFPCGSPKHEDEF
eukprot:CAMPEP_0176148894 /NCGR_PEP_ID=MMETSP0120_2-20121206/75947_1 /TAXON_ID=160619 /ORGANISM="Kryptoperidinium foliaceum, Strain CCMP 1326" /LENGTH=46 /DNA_ID= /DNA_START= /DNA_END= /DNA_ORIENTATION=